LLLLLLLLLLLRQQRKEGELVCWSRVLSGAIGLLAARLCWPEEINLSPISMQVEGGPAGGRAGWREEGRAGLSGPERRALLIEWIQFPETNCNLAPRAADLATLLIL